MQLQSQIKGFQKEYFYSSVPGFAGEGNFSGTLF